MNVAAVTALQNEKYVKLASDEMEIVKEFRYLVDRIGKDDITNRAVTSRIRAGWRKFKELSDILCGKTLSRRLKKRS